MILDSPAFRDHDEIPERHTCEGADLSPPLSFHVGLPEARSLALVVVDPDAPGHPWIHLGVFNLPPSTPGLPEALSSASLPVGARFGLNSWGRAGWGGPCPPHGRHRYEFHLYALDAMLPELGDVTRHALARTMAGKVLAEARLVGTYSLKRPSRREAART